jgi:hypothetical protein
MKEPERLNIRISPSSTGEIIFVSLTDDNRIICELTMPDRPIGLPSLAEAIQDALFLTVQRRNEERLLKEQEDD